MPAGSSNGVVSQESNVEDHVGASSTSRSTVHQPNDLPSETAAPWKTVGYPGLVEWMASSNDFLAFRQFSTLNVRVLLMMQTRIARLEKELEDLDRYTRSLPTGLGGCHSFDLDQGSEREYVLDEIRTRTREFNEHLHAFFLVHERPSATPRQITNLKNWHLNNPQAIDDSEIFVENARDLITIEPRRKSYVQRVLELCQSWLSKKYSGSPTYWYSDALFSRVTAIAVCYITAGMLFGPLWAIRSGGGIDSQLVWVVVFELVLIALLHLSTTFKLRTTYLISLGYFAVLLLIVVVNAVDNNAMRLSESSTINTVQTAASTLTSKPFPVAAAQSHSSSDSEASASPVSHHTTQDVVAIAFGLIGTFVGLAAYLTFLWTRYRQSKRLPIVRKLDSCAKVEVGAAFTFQKNVDMRKLNAV